MTINVPIVLIIFKRSRETEQVFEAVRLAKPSKLFVIADGPRKDKPEEQEMCMAARAVVDRIDWECEVFKNYSDVNLGCGKRVSSGLDWVFSYVDEAIILEDDCVPHPDFFSFCKELLYHHRSDTRIMGISGHSASNALEFNQPNPYSYYFSGYFGVWGWATWKRAWQHYDFQMNSWSQIVSRGLLKNVEVLSNSGQVKYWADQFQAKYDGLIDTWDYQWVLSCWMQNGLFIFPNHNLITNIGFSDAATHTNKNPFGNAKPKHVSFPLKHPPFIIRDVERDNWLGDTFFYSPPNLTLTVIRKLQRFNLKFRQLCS